MGETVMASPVNAAMTPTAANTHGFLNHGLNTVVPPLICIACTFSPWPFH